MILIGMFAPVILYALCLLFLCAALSMFPGLGFILFCGVVAIPALLFLGFLTNTAPPSRHWLYRTLACLLFAVYVVMVTLSVCGHDDLYPPSVLPLTVAVILWTKTRGKYTPGRKGMKKRGGLRNAKGQFVAKSATPGMAYSTPMP